MSRELIVGMPVHYTDHAPAKPHAPVHAPQAHPLDEKQFERPRPAHLVLPATVVRINNAETGDVCLRVLYPSPSDDKSLASCLPSDEPGGSPKSRGRWTPVDRDLESESE